MKRGVGWQAEQAFPLAAPPLPGSRPAAPPRAIRSSVRSLARPELEAARHPRPQSRGPGSPLPSARCVCCFRSPCPPLPQDSPGTAVEPEAVSGAGAGVRSASLLCWGLLHASRHAPQAGEQLKPAGPQGSGCTPVPRCHVTAGLRSGERGLIPGRTGRRLFLVQS